MARAFTCCTSTTGLTTSAWTACAMPAPKTRSSFFNWQPSLSRNRRRSSSGVATIRSFQAKYNTECCVNAQAI